MNYTIIKGRFHVKGYSPDGDSIRFESATQAPWDKFVWKDDGKRKAKKKQLRIEGIDALETHYEESYQPRAFGIAALEVLLGLLGISEIKYNLALTKIMAAKDQSPGWLAVAGLDRYDRPISLVFAGETTLADGAELPFEKLPMTRCVNAQLLKLGLAYPTFYDSMPAELIAAFAKESRKARKNKTGLWALDRTRDFMLWNTDTIVNDVVILPKLFRRLTSFVQFASDFAELADYMKKSEDKVLLLPDTKTTLGSLVQIDGRRIRLPHNPDDIIFESTG